MLLNKHFQELKACEVLKLKCDDMKKKKVVVYVKLVGVKDLKLDFDFGFGFGFDLDLCFDLDLWCYVF